MNFDQRIAKLKNGSDTAIWAANEIERLRKVIERLGSMEEFTSSRIVDNGVNAELLARIDYARESLTHNAGANRRAERGQV